jgi:3-hydroxyacyl-CoA dehydrogenase
VTSGLGLRWAAVGPFMANALGGGGGAAGFAHILEHIGPASDVWLEDAKEHAFSMKDTERKKILYDSVGQMMEGTDVAKIEYQRDTLLNSIVAQKAAL